jgi:RHS repeat-associated protein
VDEKTSAYDERTKHTGNIFDTDTGLYYRNARYQNPASGKFVSQDPVFWEVGQTSDGKAVLHNPQAMNSYSYAGNNPIANKDPNGRFWWAGFYTNWNGYSGLSGIAMKVGEVFGGRFAAQDAIAANSKNVTNSSAQTGVSPSVYNAIMYEENAHQFPPLGGERAIENIAPQFSRGGVGVMQVSAKTSGLSNFALLNDTTNVYAAGSILQGIQFNYGSSPGTIGAYYNSGALGPANAHAASYGQRIDSYVSTNLSPTLGDRAVRSAAGGILGTLNSLLSAFSSISSALGWLGR